MIATLLLTLTMAIPAQPAGLCVLDEPHALSFAEFAVLERQCESFNSSGAGQIEIIVTDDFHGLDKDAFADELFRKWGVSHDGVLVLLSPEQLQWRIKVGDGLKGRLTAIEATRIGRERGMPRWREAQWGFGLVTVVDVIASRVRQEARQGGASPFDRLARLQLALLLFCSGGVIAFFAWLLTRPRSSSSSKSGT